MSGLGEILSDIEKSVMDTAVQKLDAKGLTDSERGIILRDAAGQIIASQNKAIASGQQSMQRTQYWARQEQLDVQEHQQAVQADIKAEQLRKTATRQPPISEAMGRVVRPPQDDPQHRHGHSL